MSIKNVKTNFNSGRGPSGGIWSDCPWLEIKQDPNIGIVIEDDFQYPPVLVTPTITTQANYGGGYKAFGSSGGTIISGGGRWGDIVLTESDDNEGFGLATIATPFKISRDEGKLWFEARLKTNEVANTKHGFFLGLAESMTLSATVPIAAAGTLADQNFVGFHRLEADGDQIDTVYKANTVTQVTVQEDALTTALTADTYIKLGMKYEPDNNDQNYRLTYFVNGVPTATKKQIPSAAGTDFPNDVNLGLVLAGLCASNDDAIITMDWWRCAQIYK